MSKINIRRLEQLSLDMKDCLTDMSYYSAINLCVENKYLPEENEDFYKTLAKYRNQASHTYKKPPFEVIRFFYENNLKHFEEILKYINEFIKKNRENIS